MSTEGDSNKTQAINKNEENHNDIDNKNEKKEADEVVNDATKTEKPAENSTETKTEETNDTKTESTEKKQSEETDKSKDAEKPKVSEKNDVDNVKKDDTSSSSSQSSTPTTDKQTNDEKSDEKSKKEETEDSGGSDKDEEDDDKEVPLLDQPLEKTGKRERKNVQRFQEEFPKDQKDNAKVEFPNGTGTPLGSIPRIDASISRFKNDDMKLLHRILFKTVGKNTMVKKNIKRFNGFEFKRDSDDYKKKITTLQKSELKQLKSICEMLDLVKTGTKDDICERIMEFLLEPRDSGKAVGSGGRPKRTAAVRANNRGYMSHDNYSSDEKHSSRSLRNKGGRSNLKDDSSSHSDEDFEPSDDGSDEKPSRNNKRKRTRKNQSDDDDDDDNDEDADGDDISDDLESASSDDSDFQDEPKSKRKKTKANNKTTKKVAGKRGRKPGGGGGGSTATATKRGPKAAAARKRNKETSEDEEEEEESDHKAEEGSSSEDEPLAKKAKSTQPPTDDEIKSYVKEILEGADLEQITMKTVCQQVYAHYPDFDLAHKKDFIKTTVKSLIST